MIKKILQKKIIHPFLITIFPALYLYSSNLGETKFRMIAPSIIVIVGSSLALILIFWLIFKNFSKAGVFSTLLIFSFLSYQYFEPAFRFIGLNNNIKILSVNLSLIFWLIILLVLLLIVWRSVKIFQLNYLLNIISLILLANFFINLIWFASVKNQPALEQTSTFYQDQIQVNKPKTAPLPDIYYLILDGYGRADVLANKYRFDNSRFISFLENQGFYIANQATANYAQTALSLGSSMNLNYLETLSGQKNADRSKAGSLVADNALINILEKMDYRTISFPINYEFASINKVDKNKSLSYWSEFNRLMLKRSVITNVPFLKQLIAWFDVNSRSKSINYAFNHLADEVGLNTPKFTFFHVLAPHPPFIFDQNGRQKKLDLDKIIVADCDGYREQTHSTAEDYRVDYIQQIQYINQLAEKAVMKIIQNSKRPVAIVIQGDHGPGSNCDFTDINKTDLSERMSILNAYYFSDQKYDNLYKSITPVNSFRVIFNQYFNASLPILKDNNYFSTWSAPYQFIDVTDKAKQ